jgi:uncharacterized protein
VAKTGTCKFFANITEVKNMKAMNRIISILFACCLMVSACAQERRFPKPTGYINDFEGIFTARERASLDSLVKAFEKETTAQIVLATVDSLFSSREKYASTVTDLHNEWGVGKKGKNNGVLIVICNDYRMIRIDNGYGIEAKMTNEETKQIIETIILPEFRQQNFYEGTRKGILAIMKEIR